jgi:Spy/CpxP family protein refolding chaperone
MLKYNKIVMVFMGLIFISTAAAAQPGSAGPGKHAAVPLGKWWQNPATVKDLNLTQTEIDTLDSEFNNRARKFMELKHAIELERFDMERMMVKEPLDEPALMTQFNRLESARADLSKERFLYLVQVRKILGSERFQDIKSFRERMHKKQKGAMKGRRNSAQPSS